MRILAVGNMYPPHHLGGYEWAWRGAVEHLRGRGHTVRVLTTDFRRSTALPDDPDVHRELRWYWREHAFPRLSPRARLALERHNAAVLTRHLAELRPDVVSWWAMGGMSLTMIERVRRQGLPAVAFVHDDWLRYAPKVDAWTRAFAGPGRALAPLVERRTGLPARIDLAAAGRYVFVSDAVRLGALRAVPNLRDTAVAHSGIDAAFADPAPVEPWRWRLLYAGRLDERKGVDTAVRALAHLPHEARLIIVGPSEAGEEDRLRTLATRLGLAERVAFTGQRDVAALCEAYAAASVIVFPVRWEEPWGLVPLEAMSVGRPVVATGRGGSGEYLRDGENCLLFEAGDEVALAGALRRLADAPALRERLRAGGLRTAERHTAARFHEAVEAELTRAAPAAPAAPAAGVSAGGGAALRAGGR